MALITHLEDVVGAEAAGETTTITITILEATMKDVVRMCHSRLLATESCSTLTTPRGSQARAQPG
jgi:hypothetical protein